MARKTLVYTITANNRDKGKKFLITEMSPRVGHAWATRVLFGIMNSGVDMPAEWLNNGMAGVAQAGFRAIGSIRPEMGEPLMLDLLTCVQAMPNPEDPNVLRSDWDADVEEATTIFQLQYKAFELCTGFSIPAAMLTSASAAGNETAA